MPDLDDVELEKSDSTAPPLPPEEGPVRTGGGAGVLAGAAAIALFVGGIGAWLLFSPSRISSPPPAGGSPAASPSPAPSGESSPLPPLDASDGLVRDLAKGLSARPLFSAWLANRGLIRTAVAVVENVADGETPRPHLAFLAPKSGFRARAERGRFLVDPRGYEDYDGFAGVVASLDAAGCARVLRLLGPLLEAAHKELGHPEGGFPAVLERALVNLLQAPVLEGDVPVVRRTAVYEFADPKLEALSPAQKQFLRLGPRNVRAVQAKLRELAHALDIPDTRLPAHP